MKNIRYAFQYIDYGYFSLPGLVVVKRGKIIGQYWVLGLIDGCFVAGGCSIDYNGPGCDEAYHYGM